MISEGEKLYTTSLLSKQKREWDPNKSKLAAAIIKGSKHIKLEEGYLVLYLGASSGTTVSYVSDIVGKKGIVFAVEISPSEMRELVYVCEERKNIAPILADANHPEEYEKRVEKPVDFVYQDVAQKNQEEIFLKNIDVFLKKKGIGCLAVKARAIDSTARPKKIFAKIRETLKKNDDIEVLEEINLEPYEKDHEMFVIRKK